jgi:hypothetical protein
MVKTAGQVFREFGMRIEQVTLDSSTTCTKGDLLITTATGFKPATATLADTYAGKYAVALATQATAGGAVRALMEGAVGVTKLNNTVVAYGEPLGASATAGAVDVVNAWEDVAGFATEAAISGDKSVGMFLRR